MRNNATMPFGKHKGEPITEVPRQYLEWFVREVKGCGEEKAAIRKLLGIAAPTQGPQRVEYRGHNCRFITGDTTQGLPHWPDGFPHAGDPNEEPPFEVDADDLTDEFRAIVA